MTHSFDRSAAYPSRRLPVFARNLVSTSLPLAAQVGVRIAPGMAARCASRRSPATVRNGWDPIGIATTAANTCARSRPTAKARGHRGEVIDDSDQGLAAGQCTWRLGDPAVDGYVAASDSRRDGQAAGS